MNKLYVIHTQYNLIMCTGISNELKREERDIIIFQDFPITQQLSSKIRCFFSDVLILEGGYPRQELSSLEKYKKIASDCRKVHSFIHKSYDEVCIIEDMCIQEMYVMKCAQAINQSLAFSWIEDGTNAYFSNGVVSGGFGGTGLLRLIRKMFFSARFGMFRYYDLASCMGGHKLLSSVYVAFPQQLRTELRSKDIIQVNISQFSCGMDFIFGGQTKGLQSHSLIIVLDKLHVYGDHKGEVEAMLQTIIDEYKKEGRSIYYKYHPREEETMDVLSQENELDRRIALQAYLANTCDKDVIVLGVKSTALQIACKLGFKTISLMGSFEGDQRIVDFYQAIGVQCI